MKRILSLISILAIFSLSTLPVSFSSLTEAVAQEDTQTTLAAKNYSRMNAARLKKEIKATRRKIKKYKKRIRRAATYNLSIAAELTLKMQKKQNLLNYLLYLLEEAKKFAKCPVKRTRLLVTIENDSSHTLKLTSLANSKFTDFDPLNPGAKVRLKNKMKEIEYFDDMFGISFYLNATINGQRVSWEKRLSWTDGWPKKKKPCVFKYRYRVTDSDFPAPKLYYGVYGVDLGSYTSDTLWIGSPDHLKNKPRCDFIGGGNDCSVYPKTWMLSERLYSSIEEARQDLCRGIMKKNPWNMGSCNRRFIFRGDSSKYYWGCEPSVKTAVNDYCSKFNGSGVVYGTIVK